MLERAWLFASWTGNELWGRGGKRNGILVLGANGMTKMISTAEPASTVKEE